MEITKRSLLSGKIRTIDIPVTDEQLAKLEKGEGNIQDIMPNLTPSQREFIQTGITDDEWDTLKEPD